MILLTWIREEDAGLLWERVPPVCSPHLSRLGPSLVSPHMMAVEEARQRKLRKKLDRQVESGAITEEERQIQLEKVDRESASGDDGQDPSDGVTSV